MKTKLHLASPGPVLFPKVLLCVTPRFHGRCSPTLFIESTAIDQAPFCGPGIVLAMVDRVKVHEPLPFRWPGTRDSPDVPLSSIQQ